MVEYAYRVKRFVRDRSGVTALEYAAAGAFIATAMLGLVGAVGNTVSANSYATLNDGKLLLASAKQEIIRLATRTSSDPIQTGSTTETHHAREKASHSARNRGRAAATLRAAPLCSGADGEHTCKLDLSHPSFQGWKGTIVEWDGEKRTGDHDI
ncbi:MAG: hypothetical protein AAGF86_13435 [Pseudomonadota bacterium]